MTNPPPQNIEAEACVLGSILIEPAVYDLVAPMLAGDPWYKSAHRLIYEAMGILIANGCGLDVLTLEDELAGRGVLGKAGGPVYLLELCEAVPTATNAEHYARLVAEAAYRRRVLELGHKLQQQAQDLAVPIGDLQAAVARQTEDAVMAATTGQDVVTLEDAMDELMDHWARDEQDGWYCGLRAIDEPVGGFRPGYLVLIGALSGVGKTTLARAITLGAVQRGHSGCFFSREEGQRQFTTKAATVLSGVAHQHLRAGPRSEQEWIEVDHARQRWRANHGGQYLLCCSPSLTVDELKMRARKAKKQQDIEWVAVDYLQLIDGDSDWGRHDDLDRVARDLKVAAKAIGVTVICCVQLNEKQIERRSNKRPVLADIRDVGSAHQPADVVLLLYRHGRHNECDKASILAAVTEVDLAKHRDAASGNQIGPSLLYKEATTQRYRDVETYADRSGRWVEEAERYRQALRMVE